MKHQAKIRYSEEEGKTQEEWERQREFDAERKTQMWRVAPSKAQAAMVKLPRLKQKKYS